MKKLIIISVIAILLCFGTVMAAPVDTYNVETATDTLVISGKIDGYKEGNQYRIVVFGKDKSFNEDATYDDTKIAEDIIFMSQVPAIEDGSYSVRVGMTDRESGFYVIRVNGQDAVKLYYATETDKNLFLRNVKSICNSSAEGSLEELEKLLDLNDESSDLVNLFMISDPCVTSVDSSVLADVLYDEVKADPLCVSSADKFVATVEKTAHVASLNEGTIDIAELFGVLTFDEAYVKVFNEKLSDKAKKSVVADGYKGKKYNSKEAEAAFNEAVAYSYIANFASWSDAKYFVEELGKDFDVDTADYKKLSSSAKSDLYDYIADKASKASVTAFVKDVNDKIDDLKSADGGKSSGGGGGGGGSFGGGTTSGYVPVTPEVEKQNFSDMEGYEWAKESVDALFEKGIVSGVGDSQFAPGKTVTREEMIAMLIRAYGVSIEGAQATAFEDVAADSWYAPYVAVAYKNGYVNGVSATEFGAGANVTRQDASVMAYNIAVAFGKTFVDGTVEFGDGAEISEYAKKAVSALKGAGVINGKGEGNFAPKDTCTRAEAAIIIHNLIK